MTTLPNVPIVLSPLVDSPDRGLERIRFQVFGERCEIRFAAPGAEAAREFVRESVGWVQAFVSKYSRFHADSLISRINAAAGLDWVAIDAEAERMFALADRIFVLTGGLLDPTVLPLMRLWNREATPPRVPRPEEITEAAARIGWRRVRREKGRVYLPQVGMGLDFGSFGKRYAVDRVFEIAKGHDIANLMVDFGHVLRTAGAPPGAETWPVGVEDPERPQTVRMRLSIASAGVATSGDYVRFFEAQGRRYGDIIDVRSGYPVANGCRAVTVVANSCLEAGVLATTAFVLGPEDGLRRIAEYSGAEGCMICGERELRTPGFGRYLA